MKKLSMFCVLFLFQGCSQKFINLQKPQEATYELSQELSHKQYPTTNTLLISEYGNNELSQKAKTEKLKLQKEYAAKIQSYINYYNNSEVIKKSTTNRKKISNLYFNIEDHDIVKPSENIAIVKQMKESNKIPMTNEIKEYFKISIDKNQTDDKSSNKKNGLNIIYNYDYIYTLKKYGTESFYNISS